MESNIENVFNQLSNVDNIDETLKDEGLDPERIVVDGLRRIKDLQSTQVARKNILSFLKDKLLEPLSDDTLKNINSLSELIPSMNREQINMVFSKLNDPLSNPSNDYQNIDEIVQNLKSDSELLKIMRDYRPDKGE